LKRANKCESRNTKLHRKELDKVFSPLIVAVKDKTNRTHRIHRRDRKRVQEVKTRPHGDQACVSGYGNGKQDVESH
jgi:hypothetical protein